MKLSTTAIINQITISYSPADLVVETKEFGLCIVHYIQNSDSGKSFIRVESELDGIVAYRELSAAQRRRMDKLEDQCKARSRKEILEMYGDNQ